MSSVESGVIPGKESRTGAEAWAGIWLGSEPRPRLGPKVWAEARAGPTQTGPGPTQAESGLVSGDIGKGARYRDRKMGRRARTG